MLPQFGLSEFLLLAVAALIIVGPKDLPVMMRKLGQLVAKGRAAAKEFQAAFDDIARQSELEDLRKEIEDLKRANMLTDAEADMAAFEREVNADVMRDTAKPAAPPSGARTPSTQPSQSAQPTKGASHPETDPAPANPTTPSSPATPKAAKGSAA